MADTHHHAPANYSRAFAIGIALNLAFREGKLREKEEHDKTWRNTIR
jgi:hypothetical protein